MGRRDDATGQRRGLFRKVLQRYLVWNRTLLLDPWLRYHPAVSLLHKWLPTRRFRILDVGSGNAGLAYFLRKPVVSVDIQFSPDELARISAPNEPVRASAANLPFRDGSFDVVVCMDTLEHLPRPIRPRAVREIFRVARSMVILGAPFGPRSGEFDREALTEERSKNIAPAWREEHVKHGVPGEEVHAAIISAAKERRPEMEVRWFGQEGLLGLRLRWKLQFLVTKDSRAYGLIFSPLYWIHARGSRGNAYRRIYVAHSTDQPAPLGGSTPREVSQGFP